MTIPTRIPILVVTALAGACLGGPAPGEGRPAGDPCVECHARETPVIVAQWRQSSHARLKVGCLECHKADPKEPDAWEHEGAWIATIVTPKDCGQCHEEIAKEFAGSHHAKGGQILGSLDNVLGEIIEGPAAAVTGCKQCHGSKIELLRDAEGQVRRDPSGRPLLDPDTWPNTGIGRINLDGSLGSCSACHSRHRYSRSVARQPENCGKCHLGPDHPHYEIYTESKHGIAFRAMIGEMNLDAATWVVGRDYSAAPTCATCHLSATPTQPMTHDAGRRISWTLRPAISTRQEDWERKRAAMKDVCVNCHSPAYVDAFYGQYDGAVELYNEKFAKPGARIMKALADAKRLTETPFDEEVEWTWYRLWHHEGRRARHGASMMGPDYAQWHGFFEVAENFYMKFIPQAREQAHGDPSVLEVIDEVMGREDHAWMKGLSPDLRRRIGDFYRKRYGQEGR